MVNISFQEDRSVPYRFFSHFLDLRVIPWNGKYTSVKIFLRFSESHVNNFPQGDTNNEITNKKKTTALLTSGFKTF